MEYFRFQLQLTRTVYKIKWQQKVHDINNFMVKNCIIVLHYIAELFDIYIFQVQNSLQCAIASA